jgi:Tfp pilus assembly protein PilF
LALAIALACYFSPVYFLPWNHWKAEVKHAEADTAKSAEATAYQNTRPDVKYVGDQACASCHPAQAATYHRHPMGRSFAPIAEIASSENHGAETHNPFDQFGFQFSVHSKDGKAFHQQRLRDGKGKVVWEREDQVSFVLGSGTQGRAYLFDRDGYIYESPISWYSQKKIWDLSPGYAESILCGRPITANCLFCHSNRFRPVKDSLNHFEKPVFDGFAIGCERCHGPGQLHVERQERAPVAESPDDTIVNPAKLPAAVREAVCQQCHLIGTSRHLRRGREVFDYRPGLPLYEYWAIFVPPPLSAANSQAVGQVEQMYVSRCFRASQRKLGCISCHDPHELPSEDKKVDYYRQRCLQCHEEKSCTAPETDRHQTSPKDNCIQCHMPRFDTADIAHTASTDHRIRRRTYKTLIGAKPLSLGEMPIVNFYHDQVDPKKFSDSRDLGVALVYFALTNPQLGRATAKLAVPFLEESLREAVDDVPAIEARAKALWILDRRQEARVDLDRALALAPNSETLLSTAGLYALAVEDFESATDYWQRAKTVNPWEPSFRFYLARQYAKDRDWPKAIEECQAAIRLDPGHFDGHRLMLLCRIRTGDLEKARQELEILVALKPNQAEPLNKFFEDLTNETKKGPG